MANREQADPELTPEEEAELDAAVAEAELGGGMPADQVLRELRARVRPEEPASRG